MSSSDRVKKRAGERYKNGIRISDCAVYLYLIAVFGVYPWITDNKYFNITITRYQFIMFSSVLFIVLAVIAYIADYMIMRYYETEQDIFTDNDIPSYRNPVFWACAFAFAQFFAWMVAPDKKAAFSGENGRHLGLLFFLVMIFMVLCLCIRVRVSEYIFMLFAATAMYAYMIAVFQHCGNDFMGYRDGIATKQFHIFMSTFGNINIFASYLCISIPVFICIAVFSTKLLCRIVALAVLLPGGMCIMIANSDSAYLGIGAACVMIFFLAYKDGYVQRFVLTLLAIAIGNLGVVLLNHLVIKKYDKRGGVAEALDRIDLAVIFVVALCILYVAVRFIAGRYGDRLEQMNKKNVICGILVAIAVLLVGGICYGIRSGSALFTFNYEWGTYRGYIWTKCAELFEAAPIKNKIFGYGNETIKSLMMANYSQEMIDVTGKTYDNAHNEVLQYLVTTGIMGAVSYVGLCVSSVVYIIKRSSGRVIAYVSAAAVLGYFVQSLINVNQPITTPFLFVFMALGIGYVREVEKENG